MYCVDKFIQNPMKHISNQIEYNLEDYTDLYQLQNIYPYKFTCLFYV